MSSAYLTVAAVADQAGFSPRTVLRWVERGDLEAVRFPGGRLRIAESAWSAFLAERTTAGSARMLVPVDEEGGE
jgi:excisionase family DNA binding protein